LEEARWDLLTGFDALTGIAGLDIIAYVIVHSGPIEQFVDGSICAFDALVSCDWGVMVIMENLCSKGTFGDANSILIIS
jgi:hypothetical protein